MSWGGDVNIIKYLLNEKMSDSKLLLLFSVVSLLGVNKDNVIFFFYFVQKLTYTISRHYIMTPYQLLFSIKVPD